jgi:hypothetical protein
MGHFHVASSVKYSKNVDAYIWMSNCIICVYIVFYFVDEVWTKYRFEAFIKKTGTKFKE